MKLLFFLVTVVSGRDRAVAEGSRAGNTVKRDAEQKSSGLLFPPSKSRVGLPSQEVGRSPRGARQQGGFEKCFARVGVLFPGPSGRAERQTTHSMSVSGPCTRVPRTVRVWCAVADTPQSTQAVSCGSRQRLKGDHGPEQCFFSRQGEGSERSGITLPDTRGWSTKSWKWGHAVH